MKERRTKKDLDRCRRCGYHSGSGRYITCDYLMKTGKPRGCEAGLNCTRFKSGARKRNDKFIDEDTRAAIKADSKSRSEMIGYKDEALKRMHLK